MEVRAPKLRVDTIKTKLLTMCPEQKHTPIKLTKQQNNVDTHQLPIEDMTTSRSYKLKQGLSTRRQKDSIKSMFTKVEV